MVTGDTAARGLSTPARACMADPAGSALVVKGVAIMGGVEIKN